MNQRGIHCSLHSTSRNLLQRPSLILGRGGNWQTVEVKTALFEYVPMIYHRLEQPCTAVHSSSSGLSPPATGFPRRFDSLQRYRQGPPSTCKTSMATKDFSRQLAESITRITFVTTIMLYHSYSSLSSSSSSASFSKECFF